MELSNLTQEEHLALYRMMVIIRQCEEQLARAFQRGLIPGPCHTYIGEEAIASGICANLRADDAVFSTHRGHGHALAKGVSPRQLVAELFGKITGISQGRGGSMHLFAPEVGLMGTSGIVGPSILQATGAGYTFKLLDQDRVGVAFLGDGAVSNGAFHEGLNLAAIWDLPVVFVCENNMYATEVAFSDATKNQDVAARARTYGMQGIAVDGNDVMAVYAAAENAVAHARAGKGPTLIECKTYRMRPHAEGMRDGGYRTAEEIESWRQRDPITTFKARLIAADIARDSDFDSIDAEVSAIAEDAVQFAQDSPYPKPSTVSNHIFSS